jgi:hypothetical protein
MLPDKERRRREKHEEFLAAKIPKTTAFNHPAKSVSCVTQAVPSVKLNAVVERYSTPPVNVTAGNPSVSSEREIRLHHCCSQESHSTLEREAPHTEIIINATIPYNVAAAIQNGSVPLR